MFFFLEEQVESFGEIRHECVFDDPDGFHHLGLRDGQWRRKADDVPMCGFRQQPILFQLHAHFPGIKICRKQPMIISYKILVMAF